MGDVLKYRIPKQKIVAKSGIFKKTDNIFKENGFFVCDFIQNNKYIFETIESLKSDFHYSKQQPSSIEKEEYLKQAADIIEVLKKKQLQKIVYSRIKKINIVCSPINLFNQMCEDYPSSFVYLISSEFFGTWLGASPEILIERKTNSNKYLTVALAGTKFSAESVWGSKEIKEQLLVREFLEKSLLENGAKNLTISETYDAQAGNLFHLKNELEFDLKIDNLNNLIETIHPTPAVSGLPQKEAVNYILQNEKHKRELYTGIIGIKGEIALNTYVNLRCCQIIDNAAFLYLGGGFTSESDSEKEWEETEQKSMIILNSIEKCKIR